MTQIQEAYKFNNWYSIKKSRIFFLESDSGTKIELSEIRI